MKKIVYVFIAALSLVAFRPAQAQVRLNVNVNIGSQPLWGPAGYNYAEYYYMPDIDAYYYVPQRQFIYLSGSRWVRARALPARYRGYDLYRGHKVVINERNPYLRHDVYRQRYGGYRGRYDQRVIRDSRDRRYDRVKDFHGNGRKRGHYRH